MLEEEKKQKEDSRSNSGEKGKRGEKSREGLTFSCIVSNCLFEPCS